MPAPYCPWLRNFTALLIPTIDSVHMIIPAVNVMYFFGSSYKDRIGSSRARKDRLV